jgi:hypothetical protein
VISVKAIGDAKLEYRTYTRQAYVAWECFNSNLFDGALVMPYIVVDVFNQSWCGCHFPYYDGDGCRSTILIEAAYIVNCWLPDKFAIGRAILLHEMAHQYLYEVKAQTCGRDAAHSDAFARLCNSISAKAGMPGRVKSQRTWRRRQRGVSAQSWPFCLRPEIAREMRRIQSENRRRPIPRPPTDQSKVIDAARKVEAYLVAHGLADITGDYGTVLTALGIVPESTVIESVIARNT